ncbi:MAG TPA: glycosyltransferase family 1 protein [Aggregatilineales bacterium]|nr:glycosyltransferase family 1 protein [Anaerolineales bacterium]HRE47158.1 glycosyltransferase family 1 protein [Aggregatilineales bacterium]
MNTAALSAFIEAESRALIPPAGMTAPAVAPSVQRVAILSEAFLPKVDGVTRSALLTVRHLQNTGREVIIFAPSPAPTHIGTTPVITLPALPLPTFPETRIALPFLPIVALLRRFRPDIIHLFSPFSLGTAGMLAGGILRLPVIANYQTDLPAYTASYGFPALRQTFIGAIRWLHNGCTRTLAPTLGVAETVRQWGLRRVHVWGRGVDSVRFDPAHRDPMWRERLLGGRSPESLLCLYVGRLAREKSLDVLRDLAAEKDIALTLVGGGSYEREIARLLNSNGRRAHFMGELHGDDLAYAYAAADVFVFPGAKETFGQVILEALASGLPVIAINAGGPAGIITDGITGYLCAEGDSAAFAAHARRLQANPTLRGGMADAGRRYALERSWALIMGELERHYGEVMALHRRYMPSLS